MKFRGWGIFDRYNGEFSIGIDMATGIVLDPL
jgi:hypothetical protein